MKRRPRTALGLLLGVALSALLAVLLLDRGRVAAINGLLALEARLRPTHLTATTQAVDDWIPARSILLFGDSLMRMLPSRWIDPRAVNLAIGGGTSATTRALLSRQSLRRARAAVILIGTNDVQFKTDGRFDELLAALPPQLPTIVCTIPPIDPSMHHLRELSEIARANRRWAAAVAARPNTVLLHTEAVLAGPDGTLRRDLHLGDGLHLNAEGNRHLAALIREALAKIPE